MRVQNIFILAENYDSSDGMQYLCNTQKPTACAVIEPKRVFIVSCLSFDSARSSTRWICIPQIVLAELCNLNIFIYQSPFEKIHQTPDMVLQNESKTN